MDKMERTHTCTICGKEFKRKDMDFTYDCNGIPFRLVCIKCWEKQMRQGYDGQYYTELDENIW